MRIKEIREERNFTQQDVANGIGTSQRNIGRWESEQVVPSSVFVIKLADFFGVSADYLLGRTDDFGNIISSSTMPPISLEEKRLLNNFRNMRKDLQSYFLEMSETFIQTPDNLVRQAKQKGAK